MKIDIEDEFINLLGGAPRLDYENEYSSYNAGEKGRNGKLILPPHQPSEQALEFADALLGLIAAKAALVASQKSETGWTQEHRHEDAYGKAATRLWDAVRSR